jgi:hypothetical protein
MPTILRDGPYAFLYYALDGGEPPHIHVRRDRDEAKFWLQPTRLARNRGFSQAELNRIERLVVQHEQTLLLSWRDYFGA